MKWMILFTKHDFIYKMLYVGDGRKKSLRFLKMHLLLAIDVIPRLQ